MKILLYVLALAGILGLSSCQKEVNFSNSNGGSGGGGGSTSGTLLVRAVQKQGSDSSVTINKYDASKKLINISSSGKTNGADATNETRIYRNSAGIVTRTVQLNPAFATAGIDSVITYYFYDAAKSRYKYSTSELSVMGISIIDSTVLVYDATGKITGVDVYQAIPFLGPGYDLNVRQKFTYLSDGGISKVELYDVDPTTNAEDLTAYYTFTYDTKVNPMAGRSSSVGELILGAHYDWLSPHNSVKTVITDPGTPGNDVTIAFTLVYNALNLPTGGTSTQTGQADSELRMYYQ